MRYLALFQKIKKTAGFSCRLLFYFFVLTLITHFKWIAALTIFWAVFCFLIILLYICFWIYNLSFRRSRPPAEIFKKISRFNSFRLLIFLAGTILALGLFFYWGWRGLVIEILLAFGVALAYSHFFDASVPFLERILERAYFRIAFRIEELKADVNSGELKIYRACEKIIVWLVLLFKDTNAGFEMLRERFHELFDEAGSLLKIHQKKSDNYYDAVFGLHRKKQKTARALTGTVVLF